MQQNGRNIFPTDTPLTPAWGQKDQTFFSESSHVAYHIKRNGA